MRTIDNQWTAILRDPDYTFQEGRMADSLKKRAELKLKAKDQHFDRSNDLRKTKTKRNEKTKAERK